LRWLGREVIDEARGVIRQLTEVFLAEARQLAHHTQVLVMVRRHRLHQVEARLHQAGHAHAQLIGRGLGVRILVIQHLALLGELDLAMHRAGRL
jgi:hydrogenase maturation factor